MIGRLVALACLLLVGAWHGVARAELSGATDGRALFGVDQRYGGGVMTDIWGLRGRVRPGIAVGLSALSGNDEASSRVVTPAGFSLAFGPSTEVSSLIAVTRLGGYVGMEKGAFIGGGFASGAVGYAIALGEGASIRLTVDVWGLIGKRGGVFFGPAVGLGF
jgi:hypothetical protein